ncbi:MAG: glycerate kinase [Chloroflexota bacterium]
MRIAVAPNAFRGSLTATEATNAIIDGLRQSRLRDVDTIAMPLADGGDGTLEILLAGLGGERLTATVTGPMNAPVQATMGLLADGKTAVIEMARASGVELVPRSERSPLAATSYGTGELILAGLQRGYQHFVIGLGGSATVDGGAGCVQALGAALLDSSGQNIPHNGVGLEKLNRIDLSLLDPRLSDATFTALCDVTNLLLGSHGAARIFGPQKGASPADVEILERNLAHFAEIIQRDLKRDVTTIVSGGAAGGLGAGLAAFLNATLAPGGATLIALLGYDKQLAEVDLVITGEGKLDMQTAGGKAVQTIAEAAHQRNIPVIALAGTLEADRTALAAMGIQAAWSIVPGPCSLDEALIHGAEWLTRTASEVGNLLALPFVNNPGSIR